MNTRTYKPHIDVGKQGTVTTTRTTGGHDLEDKTAVFSMELINNTS